jgi:Fe-S cluster biogenesis protein NfuA
MMPIPLLHPQTTDDPRLLRWMTGGRQLPDRAPQLTALVDEGVLERVETGPGEARTWLAENRSWAVDGPRVRSALFGALLSLEDHTELSDDELRQRIEEILHREVTPIAGSHGGVVEVDSVRDGVLTVKLAGACRGCPLNGRTIGELVTRAVQARYPQIREVRTMKPRRAWLTLSRRREEQQ